MTLPELQRVTAYRTLGWFIMVSIFLGAVYLITLPAVFNINLNTLDFTQLDPHEMRELPQGSDYSWIWGYTLLIVVPLNLSPAMILRAVIQLEIPAHHQVGRIFLDTVSLGTIVTGLMTGIIWYQGSYAATGADLQNLLRLQAAWFNLHYSCLFFVQIATGVLLYQTPTFERRFNLLLILGGAVGLVLVMLAANPDNPVLLRLVIVPMFGSLFAVFFAAYCLLRSYAKR